jgi:acyl transferase domain-containing protein/NADPH:quinone reductase-like Zn-dependent oxidoreductase/acyl carrier protein
MFLKHSLVGNGSTDPHAAPVLEPIAVVGIGCRFPGDSNSPTEFWELLREGRDAIEEIPADRWSTRRFYDPEPGRPGKTYSRWGGFIKGVDRFDARFFGISPREAARMDPQQRILLEVAWEALEDAGLPLEQVSGAPVGVFIGISSWDYAQLQADVTDRSQIDTYSSTGSALSIAANRISYCLNLKGPSMVVDTACSSSLVGVHLACHSLWRQEATLALAGGVNLLVLPDGYIGFSRLTMLSPDGRCKAFDAKANGFVRSEGAGVIVLKPLAKALAAGDRIYALIRGTGVNQDGRTPGMTVPSQQAQEEVVRQTCRLAGISPRQVGYVEAHGTGTMVGDPIEARALGTVLAPGRSDDEVCLLGSVKTNLGHLEPAAGIAGLIKAILCVRHREVPANLHFTQPNPEIDFPALRLRVPRALEPWPTSGPAVALVNSFGFGGTNAHVMIEEPPAPAPVPSPRPAPAPSRTCLLPLSARSPEALCELAGRFADAVENDRADSTLDDLILSAALRRSHHAHRLAVIACGRGELAAQLRAHGRGEAAPGVVSGNVSAQQPKLVFIFSGQGPQWWAMGRQLLALEPVFRAALEDCDRLLRQYADWSLLEELRKEESVSRMHDTTVAQPALFAVQVGLAELWRSWGIVPAVVIGHSLGELAAAYVAGILGLEDLVRVVFHRSRCVELACAHGRMLAVGLSLAQAEEEIAACRDRVSVAACNGPTSLTLSGDAAALEELAVSLEQRKIFCRFLKVSHAFHSPMLDAVRDEMRQSIEGLRPREANIPMLSTVSEEWVRGPELDVDYWWRNFREPVHFAQGVERLLKEGFSTFVEISPHPVLSASVLECAGQGQQPVQVVPSLRRQEDERTTLLKGLGTLFTLGVPIDWQPLTRHGRFIPLPLYPWQRESYWHECEGSQRSRLGLQDHPLLGTRLADALPTWENYLDLTGLPYLADHRVQTQAVYPMTAYLEMGLAAARLELKPGQVTLEEIKLNKALFLGAEQSVVVQSVYHPGERSLEILSRPAGTKTGWAQHASMRLRSTPEDREPSPAPALSAARGRCRTELSREDCYHIFSKVGLNYGPRFQGIKSFWYQEGEALAEVVLPEQLHESVEGEYHFHPALLDACLQTVLGTIPGLLRALGKGATPEAYLPVELAEVRVYGRPGTRVWCHAQLVERTQKGIVADLQVYSDTDTLLWEGRGLRCQAVGVGGGRHMLTEHLYQYRWQLALRPTTGLTPNVSCPLPGLAAIAAHVQPRVEELVGQKNIPEWYGRFQAASDRLCSAYVSNALEQLGASWQPGDRFESEELARRLGVASQHYRQLERMLEWLAEDGLLRRHPAGWEVLRATGTSEEPRQLWADLLAHCPAFLAELLLLRRCGQELPRVLRGDLNVLTLLFPEGSLTTAEHFYQDAPSFRLCNLVVREALIAVAAGLPEGRPLRILEIGAGTGGLTAHLLPWLPADRTVYVFTDVSSHFLTKAGEKFQAYPFVRYQLLDIEKPPTQQGLADGSFDLILAGQVIHATAQVRQTLTHVRQLLAQGGAMIVIELLRAIRFVDLVFGLTEGWWQFRDHDLRPDHPLLSFARWQTVLTELGFQEVTDISSCNPGELAVGVLAARAPTHLQEATAAGQAVAQVPPAEEQGPEGGGTAQKPKPDSPGRWLLLADTGGVAERLAGFLRARGDRCTLVSAGQQFAQRADDVFEVAPGRKEDLERVLRLLIGTKGEGRAISRLVHLWNLDATPPDQLTSDSLSRDQTLGCVSLMQLVQAWELAGGGESRLWVVTRRAWAVSPLERDVAVSQSLATGLLRTAANEHFRLRCKGIDLGAEDSADEFHQLCEELLLDDEEDEVALRGQARYVHRYQRFPVVQPPAETGPREGVAHGPGTPFRLTLDGNGTLDGLALRTLQRRPPGPGEVEIEVHAAALNFSDVLKALGLYPGLPDGPVPLGLECGGVITAVGANVTDLMAGDRVVALGGFCLASHLTIPAALVGRVPESMSFQEAATIPIAFLTAYHALHSQGHLSEGESVLIHSATGGVGFAAVQLARLAGARIFATAGTAEKRELLRTLGIEHVMDSRSLGFADEVLRATDGRGIDVVLNSLAGDAIAKGLTTLADFGRFLEIGKRDIYANTRVGLLPFRKNVSFIAIDLDRAIRERPARIARELEQVLKEFHAGRLHPLPFRVFSISEAGAAFRYMAQGKHLGKLVLAVKGRQTPPLPSAEDRPLCRADGTYLITGGLGGFGLTTARWLVEQGARHLVLLGRSGAASGEAQRAVEELIQTGVKVLVARADVSRPQDLAGVLGQVAASMPPLRGVVHAAMVLDDGALLNLEPAQVERVLAPKAHGAWNLHLQTQHLPLDFFVCYSSMAVVFGNPGQANYSAANAFLNALASHRRARGLPALTVDWGYLSEVGSVAQNEILAKRFASYGLDSFTPTEALTLMGRLLRQGAEQAGVLRVNWPRFSLPGLKDRVPPRFDGLLARGADIHAQSDESAALERIMREPTPEGRRKALLEVLREQVSRVLGTIAARIEIDKPLTSLGMDSLMAVELRNWVEKQLRVSVPIMEMMQASSLSGLADVLLTRLGGVPSAPIAPPTEPTGPAPAKNGTPRHGDLPAAGHDSEEPLGLLEKLPELSGEQIDSLLSARLAIKETENAR